jgi:hypothetical protein
LKRDNRHTHNWKKTIDTSGKFREPCMKFVDTLIELIYILRRIIENLNKRKEYVANENCEKVKKEEGFFFP